MFKSYWNIPKKFAGDIVELRRFLGASRNSDEASKSGLKLELELKSACWLRFIDDKRLKSSHCPVFALSRPKTTLGLNLLLQLTFSHFWAFSIKFWLLISFYLHSEAWSQLDKAENESNLSGTNKEWL